MKARLVGAVMHPTRGLENIFCVTNSTLPCLTLFLLSHVQVHRDRCDYYSEFPLCKKKQNVSVPEVQYAQTTCTAKPLVSTFLAKHDPLMFSTHNRIQPPHLTRQLTGRVKRHSSPLVCFRAHSFQCFQKLADLYVMHMFVHWTSR